MELIAVAAVCGQDILDRNAVVAHRQALHPQHSGRRRQPEQLQFTRVGQRRLEALLCLRQFDAIGAFEHIIQRLAAEVVAQQARNQRMGQVCELSGQGNLISHPKRTPMMTPSKSASQGWTSSDIGDPFIARVGGEDGRADARECLQVTEQRLVIKFPPVIRCANAAATVL